MATSLDKLENKVQIHHRHVKRFHTAKKLRKSVQYIRRYLTKDAKPRRETWIRKKRSRSQISIRLFSAETTGPIFTKILHDIVALWRYLIVYTHGVIPFRLWMPERRKCRVYHFLAQNRFPWQRPLRYRKKRSSSQMSNRHNGSYGYQLIFGAFYRSQNWLPSLFPLAFDNGLADR